MQAIAAARCAQHPEVSAVDVCQRCGIFVCGECVHIRAEDVYCADCAGLLDRPASNRPKVAFALAAAPTPLLLVSAFALPPPYGGLPACGAVLVTPVALALLLRERAARRRGGSAARGAFYLLGWLAVGWNVLAYGGLFAFASFSFFR